MYRNTIARNLAAYLSIFFSLSPTLGLGCTTLSIPQSAEKIVAKSLDWHQNHGFALVNLRNLKKRALLLDTANTPAEWTSKYGSLTFNQHGREMPLGGMNEKGLTIEIMWLDTSVYPGVDKTPALTELQWIQYQLDNAGTVDEAVQLAAGVRVVPAVAPVHYLACDPSGACATFEYINKQLVIHSGNKAPVNTLTNDPYGDSLTFLAQHLGFGGTLSPPTGPSSLARFTRAASYAKAFDPKNSNNAIGYALAALKSVEQPGYTTWNLVYETANHRVHFHTKGMPRVKQIDTAKFDYSCKQKPQFVNMKAPTSGDVTPDFKNLETVDNLDLVRMGLGAFTTNLPAGTIDRVAKYPSTFQCME